MSENNDELNLSGEFDELDNRIILNDEDGNEIEFEFLDVVEVDEKEEAICGVLPGNNCGGCGYAGCSGLAAAIAKGEAPVNQCPVGGEPIANQIAEIMGVQAEAGAKMVAFVKCAGTCEKAKSDYVYTGVEDCASMAFVPGGGPKSYNLAHPYVTMDERWQP